MCVHAILQVDLLRQSDQHPNVVRYFCMVSCPVGNSVHKGDQNTFVNMDQGLCTMKVQLPYTRVNKCIRLFPKLQGNMRLLPNMCLIMKEEIDHTQNHDAFLVAHVHERRVES